MSSTTRAIARLDAATREWLDPEVGAAMRRVLPLLPDDVERGLDLIDEAAGFRRGYVSLDKDTAYQVAAKVMGWDFDPLEMAWAR